jgi:hypothetical protein
MGKQPQGQATLPAEAKKFTGKTKAQLDLSVATQRNAQTNVGQLDLMIEKAIESKAAVENLERLLNLKYEYEKRENEKAFHAAFCEMQGEFPTIKKGHSVKNDAGKVVYKYAALEDILRQIQPVLKNSASLTPGLRAWPRAKSTSGLFAKSAATVILKPPSQTCRSWALQK